MNKKLINHKQNLKQTIGLIMTLIVNIINDNGKMRVRFSWEDLKAYLEVTTMQLTATDLSFADIV